MIKQNATGLIKSDVLFSACPPPTAQSQYRRTPAASGRQTIKKNISISRTFVFVLYDMYIQSVS